MSPITRRWQRDLDQATKPIERGTKVRRIDEPSVVLRVRELDWIGSFGDKVPKALCFNSFGHGKWMRIDELEIA